MAKARSAIMRSTAEQLTKELQEDVKQWDRLSGSIGRKLLRLHRTQAWTKLGCNTFEDWRRKYFPDYTTRTLRNGLEQAEVRESIDNPSNVTGSALLAIRKVGSGPNDWKACWAKVETIADREGLQVIRSDLVNEVVARMKEEAKAKKMPATAKGTDLSDVWEAQKKFKRMVMGLRAMRSECQTLINTRGGKLLNLTNMKQQVTALIHVLERATPFSICPKCKGKDAQCTRCHGRQWVNRAQAEMDA